MQQRLADILPTSQAYSIHHLATNHRRSILEPVFTIFRLPTPLIPPTPTMQSEELPIHFPAKRLTISKIEGTHPSLLIIVLPTLLLIATASIAGAVILFNDPASDYKHGIILMLAVAAFSLGYFAHLLRQYQRNRAILHTLNRADAQPWKLIALWADVAWMSNKYKQITFGYTATINGVPQQITFADRPNLIRYRNKFLAMPRATAAHPRC